MDDDTRADLRWIRREIAAEAERIKDKQYCTIAMNTVRNLMNPYANNVNLR